MYLSKLTNMVILLQRLSKILKENLNITDLILLFLRSLYSYKAYESMVPSRLSLFGKITKNISHIFRSKFNWFSQLNAFIKHLHSNDLRTECIIQPSRNFGFEFNSVSLTL